MRSAMRRFLIGVMTVVPLGLLACDENAYVDDEITNEDATDGDRVVDDPRPAEERPRSQLDEGTVAATEGGNWNWDWGLYEDYDRDRDRNLTESEYSEAYRGVYGAWDEDDDGALSRDEFQRAAYDWWDLDGNGRIDRQEWNAVRTDWTVGDYRWKAWDAYDIDGDGYLGTTEHQEFFNEDAWNTAWDADGDGVIGRDESADTFWDLFDGNDDNLVDETEWQEWAG